MGARIITIANQKGGVCKTTTAVNLSAALARNGKGVLLVDLDPQGNATTGSGVEKRDLSLGTYEALFDASAALLDQAIVRSKSGGFDVLGANNRLVGAEVELVKQNARESKLKEALRLIQDRYDYIFIDSPPTLTLLTINGLVAADYVLVPIQCEYYALEGISDLVETIKTIKTSGINHRLMIIGVVRTLYDNRSNLSKEVSAQLEYYFKDDLFKTIIPRAVKLAEAPSHGLPIMAYDKYSKGAKSYLLLAKELHKKIKKLNKAG